METKTLWLGTERLPIKRDKRTETKLFGELHFVLESGIRPNFEGEAMNLENMSEDL